MAPSPSRNNHLRAVTVMTLAVGYCRIVLEMKKKKKEHRLALSYERGLKNAAVRDLFYARFGAMDSAFFLAMFRCTRRQYENIYNSLGQYLAVLVHPNNEYARRDSNRRCLNVDEKICIALRVAGGATAVDAALTVFNGAQIH